MAPFAGTAAEQSCLLGLPLLPRSRGGTVGTAKSLLEAQAKFLFAVLFREVFIR